MVNGCFQSGLKDSGKDLVCCGKETDWPVHLWVSVTAFALVDFHHCGFLPFCGDLACGENVVEEEEEVCLSVCVQPFEDLCWDVIWAWCFVVFDCFENVPELLVSDWLHVDRIVRVDDCGVACVCGVWGFPM